MSTNALHLESLEPRLLLSRADWFSTVAQATSEQTRTVRWQGQAVLVQATQWIVQLRSKVADRWGSAAVAAQRLDLSAVNGQVIQGLGQRGRILIEVGPNVTQGQLQRWVARTNAVKSAAPNQVVTAAKLADDPQFGQLWGLNNTGQTGGVSDADIDAPEAWETTTGSKSVVAAVIDTGIDYTHEDLAANMWVNPGEIAGNGKDDDRNGFVDDVYGYDFADGDSDPMDTLGHGTHVAGTIAGVGDNDTGVTGVAWSASLMALKIFDEDGNGLLSAAVSAINYMIMMRKSHGVNVRVANASWGGNYPDADLYNALDRLGQADILFVAAAGNDGSNNDRFFRGTYPASFDLDNILSVSATTDIDGLAHYSNTGALTVDLAAPGDEVRSTLPGNTYGTYSGTSMATPHVTGVAVLLWSLNPKLTYQQVKTAILASVDPLAVLQGRTVSGGRLNAAKAVQWVLDNAAPTGDPGDDDGGDDVEDLAGNTRTQALAVGNVKPQATVLTDAVGGTDAGDFFQFQMPTSKQKAKVRVVRTTGSGSVKIVLMTTSGQVIASARTKGRQAGLIQVPLNKGGYLVKVLSPQGNEVDYVLRLRRKG
jgi:subtilisin family serine protease